MNAKKCPVCGWEIKDNGVEVEVSGRLITVCCTDCAAKAESSARK